MLLKIGTKNIFKILYKQLFIQTTKDIIFIKGTFVNDHLYVIKKMIYLIAKKFKWFFYITKIFVIKHLLVRRILLVIYLSQMFTQIDTEGN